LSDIHANATALDAALDAVKDRWERVFCLGDIVDYGPGPQRSDRAGERAFHPSSFVAINDKAVAGLTDLEDFNPMAQLAALWTRQQMRPESLQIRRAIAGRAHFRGRHYAGSWSLRG